MLTRDFDYPLPAAAIAQRPAARGASRLLVLDREGAERHRRIADLPALLAPGDLLVVNDTRVLPARLYGRVVGRAGAAEGRTGVATAAAAAVREPAAGGGGGRPGGVELLLAEQLSDREWEVLARPGKRVRPGAVIELLAGGPAGGGGAPAAGADAAAHGGFSGDGATRGGLLGDAATRGGLFGDAAHRGGSFADAAMSGVFAEVLALAGDGRRRVRFSEPIEPHLDRLGHVPLPPYIRRADEADDRERYQTVFARQPGAIAAPTAGLHFTEELLAALARAGIERVAVTLHVGIGTFKPVKAALVSEHRMDRERFQVPEETAAALARARAARRRVVAVGTTVVRTLEAAALAGGGEVPAGASSTDLFITPGFRFQVVDVLLTNFHLPCSTLLMLVAAFAGRERVLAAYQEALSVGYRFFSYGDAMLAERRDGG